MGVEVVGLGAWRDVTEDEHRDELAGSAWPPEEVEQSLETFTQALHFRVEEFATLSDGRRRTLTDDRGWSSKGSRKLAADDPWAYLTVEAVETDVRNVVLPDGAEETPESPRPALKVLADPDTLGWTVPNATRRRYRHGTLSAYSAGKCRCRHCKDAYALYRAHRRAAGKDKPRKPRTVDTDGHIVRRWFREQVWLPALQAADIKIRVRPHDLRHAHASWLLAGGADLQVVKERLGHASIVTTEKYLHTLPDADESALHALSKVRRRSHGPASGA